MSWSSYARDRGSATTRVMRADSVVAPGQPFPPVSARFKPLRIARGSAELTADRLRAAYPQGIFRGTRTKSCLWWSTDPRMVLLPTKFKVSRSYSKTLRKAAHDPSIELCRCDFDAVFRRVRSHAATTRAHGSQTASATLTWKCTAAAWRTRSRHGWRRTYRRSLRRGAGPDVLRRIYVLARPDASKIALAVLVHVMRTERVRVIDCQQNTRHLASLGAREISRREFVTHLNGSVRAAPINWTAYVKRPLNALLVDSENDF